jgi:hypothetical protein
MLATLNPQFAIMHSNAERITLWEQARSHRVMCSSAE